MPVSGEIIGSSSGRWNEALTRARHQVYQLPEYVAFDADRVGGQAAAFLYEEDDGMFLLPFVIRAIPGTDRSDAVSPYGYPGPVCDRSDQEFWQRALAALVTRLRRERLVSLFVRLDPLTPVPYPALAQYGTLVRHGSTVLIDLRLTEEKWWHQVRNNHRRAMRKSIRLGRSTVVDDWTYLDAFVSIYHETMTRVHASPEYYFDWDYFQRLHELLPDQCHLQIVLADDEPIAGCVLLCDHAILQLHLWASRTDYQRREGTPTFQINRAARWGREHGCTVFHLGGGVGGQEDSVFDFKKGFSPNRHDFHTLRIVLDTEGYRDLVLKTDPTADPDDHSGFFPRYRAGVDQ
jgi:lipid II:glycine glycyltransferase (peptidoglycan interpeptide bridge formation enzyme)